MAYSLGSMASVPSPQMQLRLQTVKLSPFANKLADSSVLMNTITFE
jgi:hypothetical protein